MSPLRLLPSRRFLVEFFVALGVYGVLVFLGYLPGSLRFFHDGLTWFEDSLGSYRIWWYSRVLYGDAPSYWFQPLLCYPDGLFTQWQSGGFLKEWLLALAGGGLAPWFAGNVYALSTPLTVALAGFLAARVLLRGAFWPALLVGWYAGWSGCQRAHFVSPWMASTEGIVLFLAVVLHLRRRPSLRGGVAAGLAAALAGWCNTQNLVHIVLVACLYILDRFYARRFRETLLMLLAGGVAALLTAPLLYQTWAAFDGSLSKMAGETFDADMYIFRNRLSQFIIPPKESIPFGLAFARLEEMGFQFSTHFSPFPGWGMIALALLGWRTRRHGTGFLCITALVFILVSCGPMITWDDRRVGLPGPFLLLKDVPVLGSMRVTGRYVATAEIAMAFLAGFGALRLLRTRPFRRRNFLRGGVISAFILLHSFEINLWPCYFAPNQMTPFFAEVAAQPGDFSVLDIPYERGMSHYSHYGAYHRKGVIFGWGSRVPNRVFEKREKAFRFPGILVWYPRDFPRDYAPFAKALVEYNVRYIFLHELHLRWVPFVRRETIRVLEDPATWSGQDSVDPPQFIYQDRMLRVYEVRPRNEKATHSESSL
jgi:hypothetical protein